MTEKPTYTELEQQVQELRERENRLQDLLSRLPIGVYRNTPGPSGRFIMANDAIAHMFGYDSPDQFVKIRVSDLYMDPAEREVVSNQISTQEGLNGTVLRLRKKDGTPFWASVTARVVRDHLGKIEYFDGIIENITALKQAAEALNERENQLKTIVEHSNELFYIHDTAHVLTYVSPTSQSILGYGPEEMKRNWTELATDNLINRKGWEATETAIRTGNRQEPYMLELKRKDGVPVLLEIDESPVMDAFGNVVAIAGAARDVTVQKHTEARLIKSEQRFRDLFNGISDIIYTQDGEGRFTSVNPALCKAIGYAKAELIGRQAAEFMKPEFANAFKDEYLATLERRGYYEGVAVYYKKNGDKIYIEYKSVLIRPESGEPFISGTGRDITERILSERKVTKLQQKIIQAQKMESLGTLAGGIAHNFNNVLMGIQGRTSLLMADKESAHPDFEHLKGIETYVQNASELTKGLLGFARGGKYEVKPTNLNELIAQENRLFGSTKKEVTVKENFEKAIWSAEVDQGQIRQVLLNLYVNACQAMPDGGVLYTQTENVTLDADFVKPFEITLGRYVKITVTDTGVGMDKAIREKIFDPFFTTQKMGMGTGLGLASVYGIVKNHGGFIDVYSEPGKGTTFTIYLPASERVVIEEEKPSTDGDMAKGTGTILLVDDEAMILDVGKQLLETMGYRVLAAENGPRAVDLYQKKGNRIDMVILDMIMPGMSGGEIFDRLKAMNPAIKVLLSSGYSLNGQAQSILDKGCLGFIQKPFKIQELSRKIQDMIAGTG